MDLELIKRRFDEACDEHVYERAILKFNGVDGYDVYNPSVPFRVGNDEYIFGRVEKRELWASSVTRLFVRTGKDEWSLHGYAQSYPVEDPFVSDINGELVLGGTHVKKYGGVMSGYCCYFYRGAPHDMLYFTSGPSGMKDIRLLDMKNGKIGVFSRPKRVFDNGEGSQVGFTIINDLNELVPDTVENAPYIKGLFGPGQWGGANNAYLLESGKIGVVGHTAFSQKRADGITYQVYCTTAFVIDPLTLELLDNKLIATAASYHDTPAKKPHLADCVFTSGIVRRPDGKCDLYGGVRDAFSGRVVIDYPFGDFGDIL